jgi:predicted nuclease of predicted toxin-antitoxin system
LRIKVDEDLPVAVATVLRGHDHEADSVLDEGMGGWKDPAPWQAIQDEGRLLVTADKGFGDLRDYPVGTHHGVLLLRPDEGGIAPVLALMDRVLRSHRLEEFAGSLAVATPRGLRVRRPPAG